MKKKLIQLQNELKCNKSQFNKFGGYSYRSAEDIMESVKPLLLKYGLCLTVSDEIVLVGDRYYVKATATLMDSETQEVMTNSAYAREEESKKGQDSSQTTGSTSSYARKYCLSGLLLLDDNKDADTEEYHKQTNPSAKKSIGSTPAEPTREQKAKLMGMCKAKGIEINDVLLAVNCKGNMTIEQYNKAIKMVEDFKKED